MSYESPFLKTLMGKHCQNRQNPPKTCFVSFGSTHTGGIPASEWPETLELWLRKSAWTVICFASIEEAEQCSAALLGFLPPGRIEQVEGGATLQLDFRKHQPGN